MNKFVVVNGEIFNKDEVNLSHLFWENQQKLSRKIWFGFGGIPLFLENIQELTEEIDLLNLPCPAWIKNKRELFRITKRMLNKNRFYRSGYIHFQLFWNNKEFNNIITSQAFKTFDFPFSEKGILVNYSEVTKYSKNRLASFYSYNETMWNIATSENRDTVFQNSFIFNEKGVVCESISANIFFIRGNELYTPSLNTGCFNDKLRGKILEFASESELIITETQTLNKEEIYKMDELFIASEALGIQWILGIENKRFVHHYSEIIHKKLNEYLKSKVN